MKRHASQMIRFAIAFTLLLTAFLAQGHSQPETNTSHDKAGIAPISLALPSLTLVAGSGIPATVTVTNQSVIVTGRDIHANFPPSWTDVVQDASACAVLPPKSSCQLRFIPGSDTHPTAIVSIEGVNTTKALLNMTVVGPASLSVSGSPLILTPGGASGNLIITNSASSVIPATNITANFTGTALDGNVTVTSNTCSSVPPGSSCIITFTPGVSVVAPTSFPIQGPDTTVVTPTIAILNPLAASTPANTTVDTSQTATFSTTASGGFAPYTYQWQVSTDGGATYNDVTTGTGGTTSTYTTAPLTTADTGNLYRVVVQDSIAQTVTSLSAILSVNAVLVTSSPSNSPLTAVGQTAVFSTTTSGGQVPYAYQWQISTDGGITYNDVGTGAGANTNTYTTDALSLSDSGNLYRVVVTDAFSQQAISGAATLTVSEYVYFVDNIPGQIFYCPLSPSGTSFGTCNPTNSLPSPSGIAVNPAKTYVYVLSYSNSNAAVCPIQSNGSLGACTITGSGLSAPNGIAIHPNGLYAYITNQNSITKCDINALDGTLINCSNFAYTTYIPLGITINPAGNYAYIGNANYTISSNAYCALNNVNGNIINCTQTNQTTNYGVGVAVNSANNNLYSIGDGVGSVTPFYYYCDITGGTIGACNSTGGATLGIPLAIAINSPLNAANQYAYIISTSGLSDNVSYCSMTNAGPFGTCNFILTNTSGFLAIAIS